jgi:hypothetical protein
MMIGGVDFANLFISLNGKHYNTLTEAKAAPAPPGTMGCS